MNALEERAPTPPEPAPPHNCPFYGKRWVDPPRPLRLLMLSMGAANQCALIGHEAAPCEMEATGKIPDWRTCPRVDLHTIS